MSEEFIKNDYVYCQDGREYVYSYTQDDKWAWCHPVFLVQVTDYDGQGFTDEEEVAEHVVRLPLKSISYNPWVEKVHEETKIAIAKKQDELTNVCKVIAEARVSLNAAKGELIAFDKAKEDEMKELIKKHSILADFKSFIDKKELYLVYQGISDIPYIRQQYECGELRLTYNGTLGRHIYTDCSSYDCNYSRCRVFKSLYEAQNYIMSLYNDIKDKTLQVELDWSVHEFLSISDEARAKIKAKKDLERQKRIQDSKSNMDAVIKRHEELINAN